MARSRPTKTALAVGLAVAALSACTAQAGDAATARSTPTAATFPPPEDVAGVSVPEVAGYDAAAGMLGADQVSTAVRNAATVAHIALADCHRWTTGEVDPRLSALVTPELLTRALQELDEAGEYGGTVVPSLLSHLPTDDGNGNDEAAAVQDGCDDSAPLRFPLGPMSVRVASGGNAPRLRVECACVTEVTFGDTRVRAAQDWIFTMERASDGWRLSAVDGVVAHVNWFPVPPA